jgi:hypothetical protein
MISSGEVKGNISIDLAVAPPLAAPVKLRFDPRVSRSRGAVAPGVGS